MIVNLDPASGAKIEQEAAKAGVIPVDYDRLTPGGGAALYVSFDNVKVGEVQGKTLTQCPQVKGEKSVKYVEIDGAADRQQRHAVRAGLRQRAVQDSPAGPRSREQTGNWDAPTAGRVFTSMLGKNPNIKAVMVANDTMAGAVITDLKRQSLNGKVAVSGQDATAEGLQHILDGDQCFTIYKPSTGEADPAIEGDRAAGQRPGARHQGRDDQDPQTKKKVPSILATPIAITKANVADADQRRVHPEEHGLHRRVRAPSAPRPASTNTGSHP